MESDSSYICHIDSPDMPDMQSVDEVNQFKVDHYTNSTSKSQMTKVNSDYPDIIQPPTTYTLQPISVDFADHNAAIINSTPKSNSELIPSVFPSAVQISHTTICSFLSPPPIPPSQHHLKQPPMTPQNILVLMKLCCAVLVAMKT